MEHGDSSPAPRIRRRNPKGGRPPKADGSLRDGSIVLRVTEIEKAAIQDAAKRTGLTASEYLRRLALTEELPFRREAADPALLHELNAVGNNVNQLARSVHLDTDFVQYWREIGAELRAVLRKVARVQ